MMKQTRVSKPLKPTRVYRKSTSAEPPILSKELGVSLATVSEEYNLHPPILSKRPGVRRAAAHPPSKQLGVRLIGCD